MKKLFALLVAFFTVNANSILGLPAQVILIGPAEKDLHGNGLSLKGRERAAALAPYFIWDPDMTVFGPPAAIFAQGADKQDPSVRAIETVLPLAVNLKQDIRNQFGKGNFAKMIDEIKNNPAYNGRMVLISWDSQEIPEIARALGTLQAPSRWNGDAHDRVWILSFQNPSRIHFRNISQKLMYGDGID